MHFAYRIRRYCFLCFFGFSVCFTLPAGGFAKCVNNTVVFENNVTITNNQTVVMPVGETTVIPGNYQQSSTVCDNCYVFFFFFRKYLPNFSKLKAVLVVTSGNSSEAVMKINGCATLDGDLVIRVEDFEAGEDQVEVSVLEANCLNGTFNHISIQSMNGEDDSGCKSKLAVPKYSNKGLSVIVSSNDCSSVTKVSALGVTFACIGVVLIVVGAVLVHRYRKYGGFWTISKPNANSGKQSQVFLHQISDISFILSFFTLLRLC